MPSNTLQLEKHALILLIWSKEQNFKVNVIFESEVSQVWPKSWSREWTKNCLH